MLAGCAEEPVVIDRVVKVPGPPRRVDYANLSQAEIDYIERFNVTAKNIRDFPPKKEKLEKYFYIFKNVANLKDAKFLLFGEMHNNSASQLWTAGAMNELIDHGDYVLFEGNQSTYAIPNIEEHVVHDIFAAREFELRKITYTPTSIMKLRKKFQDLFDRTKEYLTLNILNLHKGKAFFWDLRNEQNLRLRNEAMVETLKWAKKRTPPAGQVFVNAGARHLPHYEFAAFIFEKGGTAEYNRFVRNGGRLGHLNGAFFDSLQNNSKYGTTESIYNYLKTERYAILIPKNMPSTDYIKYFFPTSF